MRTHETEPFCLSVSFQKCTKEKTAYAFKPDFGNFKYRCYLCLSDSVLNCFCVIEKYRSECVRNQPLYVESAECLNQNPFRFHVSSLSIGEETLEDYPAAYLTYNDEAQFFTLIEGTLPGNEQEILVPAETSLNVGDQLGDYIVVGIYQPTHFIKHILICCQ